MFLKESKKMKSKDKNFCLQIKREPENGDNFEYMILLFDNKNTLINSIGIDTKIFNTLVKEIKLWQ